MTKRERMAAYREAARRIAEGESRYSCLAVRIAAGKRVRDLREPLSNKYALMISRHPPFQVMVADFELSPDPQAHRVLALLLAAEMVRTGDL